MTHIIRKLSELPEGITVGVFLKGGGFIKGILNVHNGDVVYLVGGDDHGTITAIDPGEIAAYTAPRHIPR